MPINNCVFETESSAEQATKIVPNPGRTTFKAIEEIAIGFETKGTF